MTFPLKDGWGIKLHTLRTEYEPILARASGQRFCDRREDVMEDVIGVKLMCFCEH